MSVCLRIYCGKRYAVLLSSHESNAVHIVRTSFTFSIDDWVEDYVLPWWNRWVIHIAHNLLLCNGIGVYTVYILFTYFGYQLKTLLESLSKNYKPIINWKSLYLNQPHLSNGFSCISHYTNWFLCPQAGTFGCNRAIHSYWPKFQNQISQIKHTLNIDV